jgi:hypothetical protein
MTIGTKSLRGFTCAVVAGIGLALFSGIPPAGAAVLFDNLGQTPNGSIIQIPNATQLLASDFKTDANGATATKAGLRLFNSESIPHNFTVSIYTDNAGVPGTLVGSFNTLICSGNGGSDFQPQTTSPGITLAANTIFWEVINMNEAKNNSGAVGWRPTTSQSVGGGSTFTTVAATQMKLSTNGTTWSDAFNGNGMMYLEGSPLPEPSAALLLPAAAGLFASVRRGRRQS